MVLSFRVMDFPPSHVILAISISTATTNLQTGAYDFIIFDLLVDPRLSEWSPTEPEAAEEVVLLDMGLPPVR